MERDIEPGGFQVEASVESSVMVVCQDQHTSNALVDRGSGNTSNSNAEEQRVAVRMAERTLQQRLDRGCEQCLWSTTRLGCKPCTDSDWAYEKKPPSAHDDDWTDLV